METKSKFLKKPNPMKKNEHKQNPDYKNVYPHEPGYYEAMLMILARHNQNYFFDYKKDLLSHVPRIIEHNTETYFDQQDFFGVYLRSRVVLAENPSFNRFVTLTQITSDYIQFALLMKWNADLESHSVANHIKSRWYLKPIMRWVQEESTTIFLGLRILDIRETQPRKGEIKFRIPHRKLPKYFPPKRNWWEMHLDEAEVDENAPESSDEEEDPEDLDEEDPEDKPFFSELLGSESDVEI